jgi:hypothetical protein
MSIKSLYPDIRPSLNLDFANSKALDGRITFTRNSTGTYVGANGLIQTAPINAPRFDHDPVTGESLGLLIEEQRTNKFSYSEQFVNTGWDKSNIIITYDQIISPDGSLNADKFKKDSSNTESCFMTDDTSLTNGVTYTQSIWAKAGEKTHLQIAPSTGFDSRYQNFNLVTGTLGNGDVQSASIEAYGNGWYRCSVTQTANNSTSGRMVFALTESNSSSRISAVSGNEGDGIYIWGAQLEVGSFPTSYIPTSGSTVTRPADTVTISGSNFSNWYNPTEGTVFFDSNVTSNTTSFGWIIHAGSDNDRYGYNNSSTAVSTSGVPFVSIGAASADFGTGPTNIAGGGVMAYAYKSSDYAVYGNGIKLGGSGISQVVSGASELAIGFRGSYNANTYMNGTIKKLAYYPQRLTNAQLQTLTQ